MKIHPLSKHSRHTCKRDAMCRLIKWMMLILLAVLMGYVALAQNTTKIEHLPNYQPPINIPPKIDFQPRIDQIPNLKFPINNYPKFTPGLSWQPKFNSTVNWKPPIIPQPQISLQLKIDPKIDWHPPINIQPHIDIQPKFEYKPNIPINFTPQFYPVLNYIPQIDLKFHQIIDIQDQLNKALKKQTKSDSQEDTATTLSDLGLIKLCLGDLEEAEDYYQDALRMSRKRSLQEKQPGILLNLALVAFSRGDYGRAFGYCEEAIENLRAYPELKKEESQAFSILGLIAFNLGDYIRALESWQSALEICSQLNMQMMEANLLNNLGLIAYNLREYEKAQEFYLMAMETYQKLGLRGEIITTFNIADIYIDLEMPQAIRSISEKLKDPIRLGFCCIMEGNPVEAKLHFSEGLSIAQKTGYLNPIIASTVGLGIAEEMLGNFKSSVQHFTKAAEAIEEQRESILEGQRGNFFKVKSFGFSRLEPYEGLVRGMMNLGNLDKAFHYAEYTKARALLEAISRGGSKSIGISLKLRRKESQLNNRIAAIKDIIMRAEQKENGEADSEAESELTKLKDEQSELIHRIREEHPEYAMMKYPTPLSSNELALKTGEVLIEYEVTEPMTIIFIVRSGIVEKTLSVEVKRKELNQMVAQYRSPFEAVTNGNVHFSDLDLSLGSKLYEILLKDALAEIREGESILIVPDEMLCLLPFEALIEKLPAGEIEWLNSGHGLFPKGVKYVGDGRVFSYWQSASSLTAVRRLQKNSSDRRLLVVADPVFNVRDKRVGHEGTMVTREPVDDVQIRLRREFDAESNSMAKHIGWQGFERLPSTSDFASDMEKSFGRNAKTLTGLDANETKIRNEKMGRYGLGVIYATHGLVDERVPYLQQAAILLSNPSLTGELLKSGKHRRNANIVVDGFLTMSEMMGLPTNTEVVAALACKTGVGQVVGGEGVMNLSRAFQCAGARSVLVSLWSVEDISTNLFGERFFESLRQGEAKDTALLSARQNLRDQGYQHPFYWAPFVLIGERDLLKESSGGGIISWVLITALITALSSVVIWMLRRRREF